MDAAGLNETIRFTAVEDFYSEETKSHYVAGLGYTATAKDFTLLALLNYWFADGKIVFGGGAASMQGKE